MFKSAIQIKLSKADLEQALGEYLCSKLGPITIEKMEMHTSGGHSVTLDIQPAKTSISAEVEFIGEETS